MNEERPNLRWIGGIEDELRKPFQPESPPEIVCIEMGFELTQLIDNTQKGELGDHVKRARGGVSRELGFAVPVVHLRGRLDYPPNEYRIKVNGVLKWQDECYPHKLWAERFSIFPRKRLPGKHIELKDLSSEAIWISKETRDEADKLGYHCLEPESRIAIHLSHVMKENGYQLLGYDATHQLMEGLWQTHPQLVDALVPGRLSLVQVWEVLRGLLEQRLTLKRMLLITETMLKQAQSSQKLDELVNAVHQALAHSQLEFLTGWREEQIPVIGFDNELCRAIFVHSYDDIDDFVESDFGVRFCKIVVEVEKLTQKRWPAVNRIFLVPSKIRYWTARVMARISENYHVYSPPEIPKDREANQIGVVKLVDIGG